ncbi:Tn3 family transposase [Streptomyces mirabilis]|uniref:Tn3 family transposase n=1 Tax=Streptomyces mirabilis TaxID=68239 RepID=UPI003699160E
MRHRAVRCRDAAGGGIGERYLTAVGLKAAGVEITNATFAVRQETVWGQGTTTVASDSTHFKAWDRNIFTEWHSRYGGRGVLVYWHIEKGSMAIHSQLLNCTASEVAAAIEGMMRHATTMQTEGNYVDSHGQSEIGFGLTRLLGYDLLPRIKQINKVKLYRPGREDEDSYERVADAMTRPIRWDVIENNYDQLIKYATAIRVGTASTKAILRRFTRTASHPVYQAMLEVGRAQKTIFVARYLRDRDLQREIQEGLNVVEGWNGANDIIFFGKSGELSSNPPRPARTLLSHYSLVQYRLPGTGELIPLLHIAPSKTDAERLLVISPELADVLSTIISRIRDENGSVPLVVSYDGHERVWNPPMPLLFQRNVGVENRPIPPSGIRQLLNEALSCTGLSDTAGQPLAFSPHDFRRLFITDAIMNGMPPHIAQLVVGHRDINTTMGYKTVYPEEVINGHRAFIARRRATRPSEEYRTPTEAEWEEFLGHFERRRVALGDCGRAYGTSCVHEHSSLRCSLLRPDPDQRHRIVAIRDNLLDRIAEAEKEGWLGEVEGLKVSLAGAADKLAQIDRRSRRRTTVRLGMPRTRSEDH